MEGRAQPCHRAKEGGLEPEVSGARTDLIGSAALARAERIRPDGDLELPLGQRELGSVTCPAGICSVLPVSVTLPVPVEGTSCWHQGGNHGSQPCCWPSLFKAARIPLPPPETTENICLFHPAVIVQFRMENRGEEVLSLQQLMPGEMPGAAWL